MKRVMPILLLLALAPGCGAVDKSHRTRWDTINRSATEKDSAAVAAAAADSTAFFEAVNAGDHNAALATLWGRSAAKEPEKSRAAGIAGCAAFLSGVSLFLIADDELDDIDAAEQAGFKVDDYPWDAVQILGIAAALAGGVAIVVGF